MGVPGTFGQLLILFLFVLPGSVFQTARTWLRGPVQSDQDATTKVLLALAVSTALDGIYLAIFGGSLLRPLSAHSVADVDRTVGIRAVGLWSLAFLFVLPACLAALNYWASRGGMSDWLWSRLPSGRPAYHSAPRTWDYAFTDIRPGYLRVQLVDGRWNGGWFGEDSMASSFPGPLEVFIEKPWRMSPDGEFLQEIAGCSGLYVRCDDVRVVEFFDGTLLTERSASGGDQDVVEVSE